MPAPNTLWVPPSATVAYRCRVPIGGGKTCGKAFSQREQAAFERHVIRCADEHRDAIESERPGIDVFEPWDPEYAEHMRVVGERMEREGRMYTRPNER